MDKTFIDRCAKLKIRPDICADVYDYCYPPGTKPVSAYEKKLLDQEVQYKLEKLAANQTRFIDWWLGRISSY